MGQFPRKFPVDGLDALKICRHGDIFQHCRTCQDEIQPEVQSLPDLLKLAVKLAKSARRSNERQAVYFCVDTERAYQDKRWPLPDHKHEVESFLVYIEHYVNELKRIRSTSDQYTPETIIKTQDALRKIIALGVACAEQHGIRPREEASGLSANQSSENVGQSQSNR